MSFVFRFLEHEGHEGYTKYTKVIFAYCFPDIDNTVDAIVSEGNAVKCQVLITGTQKKDFPGIENKGRHFESDHIFIFHLNEENKIKYIEVRWDHNDLVQQLS